MVGKLTLSAYAVLGLLARHGPMTSYDLKARVEESIGFFWPIPHAQLYRDPARLTELGLLTEEAEEGGRRRKLFHLTAEGHEALDDWITDPDVPPAETRDPAQLKLFFADLLAPAATTGLAAAQAARHQHLLSTYQERLAQLDPEDPASRARARLLTFGMRHEEAHFEFWQAITADPNTPPQAHEGHGVQTGR
ncbi:PadR family transcriptional regulator [Streptomyces sp. NPDC056486]|uniref:PadR family transcriptional regulator n=1 Tax=Streptomyces sp. NPDC056486 TaxID=3345835 RepID=UPI0036BF1913